jgi:hypothetical protein
MPPAKKKIVRISSLVAKDDPYLYEEWLPIRRWEEEIYKAGFGYLEFCRAYKLGQSQLTDVLSNRRDPESAYRVHFRRCIEHARSLNRPPFEGKRRAEWNKNL